MVESSREYFMSFLDSIQNELDDYKAQVETLTKSNTDLETDIRSLRKVIVEYDEERKEFRKVSNIVKIDRENSLLKNELKILRGQIAKNKENKEQISDINQQLKIKKEELSQITEELKKRNNSIIAEEATKEQVHDEYEESHDVYEKTIKGITYYVSIGDDRTIYERNLDETIGNAIGKLEIVNGRLKASFTVAGQ